MDTNDRSITVFTSLAHAMFHTYELSIPLFVVFWLAAIDVSTAVIGIVLAGGYGLIGLLAPVSGAVADTHGSRRLITISIIGMAIGFGTLALATNVFLLAVAVLIWGAGASLYHPAGLSLISRSANARGAVFAYHGAGGNVGTAAGPIVTATLLLVFEWRIVVVCLLAPAVVAVLLGLVIEFEEDRRDIVNDSGRLSEGFRRMHADSATLLTGGFLLAFAVVLTYGTYYRGLLTFLPGVIRGLSVIEIGTVGGLEIDAAQYVYSALLTVGIAGQFAGGKLTDRIRSEYALLSSMAALCALAALFFPSAALGPLPFLAVVGTLGFFLYATAPIYQVVIAEQAPEAAHGLSYGYTYLGMFGIGAVGASLAGFLLTYGGPWTLFYVLSALAFVGLLLTATLIRR